jgi:hypothetical protein
MRGISTPALVQNKVNPEGEIDGKFAENKRKGKS